LSDLLPSDEFSITLNQQGEIECVVGNRTILVRCNSGTTDDMYLLEVRKEGSQRSIYRVAANFIPSEVTKECASAFREKVFREVTAEVNSQLQDGNHFQMLRRQPKNLGWSITRGEDSVFYALDDENPATVYVGSTNKSQQAKVVNLRDLKHAATEAVQKLSCEQAHETPPATAGATSEPEIIPSQDDRPEISPVSPQNQAGADQVGNTLSSYFGETVLSEDAKSALDSCTVKREYMRALREHCSGLAVTYDPAVTTPLSQAIKAVSIPNGREIPHFSDLYHQLKDASPNANISISTNEPNKGAIIIQQGDKSICLVKRHALGGKVTIFFGEQEKGGMWNDKVGAVVLAFLASGDYPGLKAEQVATARVIQDTPASSTVVEATMSDLSKSGYTVGNSEILGEANLNLRGYKVTKDGVTLYVRRVKSGDHRFFNVYSDPECLRMLNNEFAPLSATDLRGGIALGFIKQKQKLEYARDLVQRFNGFSRCCDKENEGYNTEYTENGYNPRHVIMTKVAIELGVITNLNLGDEAGIKQYLSSERFDQRAFCRSLAEHLVGNKDAIENCDNLLRQYEHSEESSSTFRDLRDASLRRVQNLNSREMAQLKQYVSILGDGAATELKLNPAVSAVFKSISSLSSEVQIRIIRDALVRLRNKENVEGK
jgi:hypothetical protein